ncbi:hypothetical protein D9615_004674 [Tricholomella constricta]|uniref:Uncharacterized protein n=1 Tax=Tricholomella constricta TaxID=117010 RepID=A0A8H5HCN1_9AGAR|nr:hypothetical protein D9615_004674 [Tricholomella constricta]
MSSGTPDTDLWLERSRFNGMLLGGVSYGVYFLLTMQAIISLVKKARQRAAFTHLVLLSYIIITFILATIGFAGNAKYTQTIWIDSRDVPGGPPVLITTELDFWINRMALSCYYVMEWFMSALLLYRCIIIWDRNIAVVVLMTSLFLGSIAMSVLVLVQSRIKDFYDINVQIAYLSLTVGTNILYTLLVVTRLLMAHGDVKRNMGKEQAGTYITIIAMIVESAAMYSVLGVLYIASFATHSNCSNLIFLSISHVQGIAQLLIILRVAEGRAFTGTVQTRSRATTTLEFGVPASHSHGNVSSSEDQRTTVMGGGSAANLKKQPSGLTSIFRSDSSKELTVIS